jgi:multiple antibiotic resistance protein
MLDAWIDYGRDFLFGFMTLFSIINPYGLSFIFLRRTIALSHADQRRVARKIAIYAFFVLVVSLFGGAMILGLFGISVSALRIAGGIVVVASGWSMLNERPQDEDNAPRSTAGYDSISAMAFFPLTVPLTTGPGTVATAIALGASRPETLQDWFPAAFISLLMAAGASLVIYHAYSQATRMARWLGREGTSVVTSISAFLLMCVGVEIVLTGLSGAVDEFLARR